jgi:16S rRNA processing protein RimM
MIHIATIGKAVGLKGEVKLHLYTDFPKQFKKGTKFSSDNELTLEIEYFNPSRSVVKFVGFDDKDSTIKLTNKKIYSTEEQTRQNCVLQKDEYYWFDIIGCSLFEGEKLLGVISNIDDIAGTYYFEIKTDDALVKSGLPKIFLVPYLDNYINSIDIESKRIDAKNCKVLLENS